MKFVPATILALALALTLSTVSEAGDYVRQRQVIVQQQVHAAPVVRQVRVQRVVRVRQQVYAPALQQQVYAAPVIQQQFVPAYAPVIQQQFVPQFAPAYGFGGVGASVNVNIGRGGFLRQRGFFGDRTVIRQRGIFLR